MIKEKDGVYRYEPDNIHLRKLEDFSNSQVEEIFKKDNYKCVVCGLGRKEGLVIHADHIKPKDKGGKAVISNGQTLCSIHNFRKKNYNQTESGKKMFIHLYELSQEVGDKDMIEFCKEILNTYKNFNMNDHIDWKE